jgi:hypothetical protein
MSKAVRGHVPEAIISGAQTGADRGGLEAAIEAGLKIGGYVPRGRRAEDGRVPDRYPVWELKDAGYTTRTRENIRAADATLIFAYGKLKGGSKFTETECLIQQKPYTVIDLESAASEALALSVRAWLTIQEPRVLNVAGSRESSAPGIQALVQRILRVALLGA